MRNTVTVATLEWLGQTEGQDLIEYCMLTSLIALFAVGGVTLAGKQINEVLWAYISKLWF